MKLGRISRLPVLKIFRPFVIDIRDVVFHFLTVKNSNKLRPEYIKYTQGKIGLEIGGPSWLWKTHIPIYRIAKKLDNFDRIEKNQFNYFLLKKGDQYVSKEAKEAIYPFSNESYDFILARHVLEHIANPIKLLNEWRRIIKRDGILIITVPNKFYSFDYPRPYTTFVHLLDDYINDIKENDTTHFQEVKDLLHDHCTPEYSTREEWAHIVEDNINARQVHHHVFSEEVIARIVSEAGFRVLDSNANIAGDTVVLAQRYDDKNLRHKPSIEIIRKYESD